MAAFPTEKLLPLQASLTGLPAGASLTIALAPFELDGTLITTEIRATGIALPSLGPAALNGRTFAFPTNPEDGYIDGSIYIEHAHHPFDITEIAFAIAQNGSLGLRIRARLVLSYEGLGDYEDTDVELRTSVSA